MFIISDNNGELINHSKLDHWENSNGNEEPKIDADTIARCLSREGTDQFIGPFRSQVIAIVDSTQGSAV